MSASYIWNFFKQKGLTEQGIAGLMGNLYAESGLNPKNLQQTYEKKLGMTDASYTQAVDNNTYKNFVKDSAGYGLAQWTYYSRKQNLLDFAKANNKSIGDLQMQVDFLWKELTTSFPQVVSVLKTSKDIRECSNIVLLKFEIPANTGESMQQKRAEYSQKYYNDFATNQKKVVTESAPNTPTANLTSSIVDVTILSPNRNTPRRSEIDTVTIHCVVGQCTAESLGNYFANPARKGSSNYGVDKDGRIGLYVPETDRAWTSGGVDLVGREIFVNGISGSMNDHRAITIEVASDTFEPYAVTDAALQGLIKLLVDICKRHPKIHRLRWQGNKSLVGNTALQNMTAHRWFANTKCPGDYLFNKFNYIAQEVNKRLDAEQLQVINEEDDMTVERFTELWHEMRNSLQDNDASTYSNEARQWAIGTGLIKGGTEGTPTYMWEDMMTREQFVTVLYRFAQMIGKV